MLTIAAALLMTAAAAQDAAPEPPQQPYQEEIVPLGVDLLPGVGSSSYEGPYAVRSLSLNVIGGKTYGLRGIELGSAFNIETGFVEGAQGAGAFNLNFGRLQGAQGAGGFNYAGEVEGVQGAGGFNVSRGGVQGVQGAGGLNVALGDLKGVQGSGGINYAHAVDGVQAGAGLNVARSVEGVQASGGANLAMGDMAGVQGATGLNVVTGDLSGLQASGGLNVVTGDVRGMQMAPVNVATGDVSGLQLGVVNVAKSSDVSLGLLNFIWNGRTHLDVWGDSWGFAHGGIRHGSRYLHNIYWGGVPAMGGEAATWTVGLGLGGHIPLGERAAIDLDLLAHAVNEGVWWSDRLNLLNQGRAVLVLNPLERLGVYAGPTYDVRIVDTPQKFSVIGRPGVTAGIQLF